jgi:hypothetical protein
MTSLKSVKTEAKSSRWWPFSVAAEDRVIQHINKRKVGQNEIIVNDPPTEL